MLPAARLCDLHVCPMVTGVIPHVGAGNDDGSISAARYRIYGDLFAELSQGPRY